MAKAAPAVYAIAWNNHFLCARFEAPEQGGRVYLIDSLGRTLHSLCSSAFILRFAEGAQSRGHSRSGSQEAVSPASSTSSLCVDEPCLEAMPAWRTCELFFRNVYAGGVMTRLRGYLDQLSARYAIGATLQTHGPFFLGYDPDLCVYMMCIVILLWYPGSWTRRCRRCFKNCKSMCIACIVSSCDRLLPFVYQGPRAAASLESRPVLNTR